MPQKVIVGLDESEGGRRALTWALTYAQDRDVDIEVVTSYVREPAALTLVAGRVDERGWAEQQQAKAVEEVRAGFADPPSVRCRVVEGAPVDVLCAAADDADLLVLGSHGMGRVASVLLGSTSAGCLRHAVTPVVIVPARDLMPARRA